MERDELLTPNQIVFLLIGFAVGPGFLKLPNAIVSKAYQDSWISALIALIYPASIIFISLYIIKRHPKESILYLSSKYFGRILGGGLNFIFISQFVIYAGTMTSEFIKLTRVYMVGYTSTYKVAIIGVVIATIGACMGLKVLGKISEIVGYAALVTVVLSAAALQYGSVLNIQPVFGAGSSNIIKGAKETIYFYLGFETLLLIHPYAQDTKKIKKSALEALLISGVIWVWTVFITIFYLGIDLIPKSFWSFVLVFESIHLPIINNFRYVAMFTWTLIIFRIVANDIYIFAFGLKEILKTNTQKVCLSVSPIILYLSLLLLDEKLKFKVLNIVSPGFMVFNYLYILSVVIAVFFNRNRRVAA